MIVERHGQEKDRSGTRLILVTGSRDWADRDCIEAALEPYIADLPASFDSPTVMHGAARGADAIAGELALDLGFWVQAHPADWAKDGKRAGILRNLFMLDQEPDVVLAFQRGNESPGTKHTIAEARKRGIPTVVHRACAACGSTDIAGYHGNAGCRGCGQHDQDGG